ncbi:MAG: general secretion pathway protein GspK [Geobacteraceae bacterium GWC2_58_44]|nr:MAG: general secretion pathway protein GspK [Geobacteraceae bacterium GWC2_58_44]HBG05874.1 general secretion pathway protein GspK [Geobacter sp.]
MRGERGFALVITLIVTALLVALLVEFVSEVYVDTSHSHNFVASQQAGILAESGIAGGIKLLQSSTLMRKGEPFTSLLEIWAKPQVVPLGEGTVSVSIEEESGKLDLNSVALPSGVSNDTFQPIFLRLLTHLKLSPELYEAMADWADTDAVPRPNGAETAYYSALKSPYQAHDESIDTVEELALVKGFTPEVLAKLSSCVTVYGSAAASGVATPININTAPKELLAALDEKLMSGDLVERILEYRKTKPIKSLSEIPGLDTLVQSLQLRVVYQGTIYRIRAEGKVGDSVSVAEAVVKMDGLKPTVLYWREY